jgi:hypothetical protein
MYMRDKAFPNLSPRCSTTYGFDAVKMKVAGAPFKEDVARVVQFAIGPGHRPDD